MKKLNAIDLFKKLNKAETEAVALKLKDRFLKDNPDQLIEVPFGNNLSNAKDIQTALTGGAAAMERVANIHDSYLELGVAHNPEYAVATSPRDLLHNYMGIDLAHMNIPQRSALASEIGYVQLDKFKDGKPLLRGSKSDEDCVSIVDFCEGISPEDMMSTILTTGDSNKIDKPWLQGQYGQGGSSTFGYCMIALVASRAQGSDVISYTLVYRILPNDNNGRKLSTWMMILDKTTGLPIQISANDLTNRTTIKHGTVLRHYNYDASTFNGLTLHSNSLRDLYSGYMMSSELPLTFIDNSPAAGKGKRNDHRLWGWAKRHENYLNNPKCALYNSIEYVTQGEAGWESVTFTYKGKEVTFPARIFVLVEGKKIELGLPGNSESNCVITFNGQTHARLDGRNPISRNFPNSRASMVVEMDFGGLSVNLKDDVMLSHRELKDTELVKLAVQATADWAKSLPGLRAVEASRRESVLTDKTEDTGSMDMINKVGLNYNIKPSRVHGKGRMIVNGIAGGKLTRGRPYGEKGEPKYTRQITTSKFPTYIEFAQKGPVNVYVGDKHTFEVRTDADDSFANLITFRVKSSNRKIKVHHTTPLHNGRTRVTLDTTRGEIDDAGAIIAELKLGRGNNKTGSLSFVLDDIQPHKGKKGTQNETGKMKLISNSGAELKVEAHPVNYDSTSAQQERLIDGRAGDLYGLGGLVIYNPEDHTVHVLYSQIFRTYALCGKKVPERQKPQFKKGVEAILEATIYDIANVSVEDGKDLRDLDVNIENILTANAIGVANLLIK